MKRDREKINNLILAIYLSIPMLTKIVSYFYKINNNIVIITALILIISIVLNIKKIKISFKFIIFNLILFILFLLSFLVTNFSQFTINYLFDYLLYGLSGLFLLQFDHSFKNVLINITYIYLFYVLLLPFFYNNAVIIKGNTDYIMDLSYTLLIGFFAMAFSFKYIEHRIIKIIIILTSIYSLYYLIFLNTNRGSMLALIFFIVIFCIKKIKKRSLKIIFPLVIGIGTIFFFDTAISYIKHADTDVAIIRRLKYQLNITDMSSGRINLYKDALNLSSNHILLGSGIGYFENENNGQYTHNLFLGFICDYGWVIGCIISLMLICYIVNDVNNSSNDDINCFLLFCLLNIIPRLFISSTYWLNSFFWIYIYIHLTNKRKELDNDE